MPEPLTALLNDLDAADRQTWDALDEQSRASLTEVWKVNLELHGQARALEEVRRVLQNRRREAEAPPTSRRRNGPK